MTDSWEDPTRYVLRMKLDSGRACLDLLNTLVPAVPPSPPGSKQNVQDFLQTYSDLVALAVRTVRLKAQEADELQGISRKNPESGEETLAAAKNFRRLLSRLLINSIENLDPLPQDLSMFEELRYCARNFEVFVWEDGRYTLKSRFSAEGLMAPLNAFARDADELLRSRDCTYVQIVQRETQEARFIVLPPRE